MTSQNRTYYEILDVRANATFEEIRDAFRQRAREFHPDRNPSPDAVERMQEVNEAYEVLRDEGQRGAYDRMHRQFATDAIELERAHTIANIAVGELAYDLGRDIGDRVRNDWTQAGIGGEDTPSHLWVAVYEAAFQAALESHDSQSIYRIARAAAWEGAHSEVARQARVHTLLERAPTPEQAFATSLAIQIVGVLVSKLGQEVGFKRSVERLATAAYPHTYGVAYRAALEGLQQYPRTGTMRERLDSIAGEVALGAQIALRPYAEEVLGRAGLAPTSFDSAMTRGRGGGEGAMGCGLLMIFIGGLITLGTFLAAGPGASFYVFGGAVLFGGINFIRGWLASGDRAKIVGAAILAILFVVGYVVGDVTGFNQAMS